jgi:FHA domain
MFDDGAIVRVAGEALIGRNPAPLPGEGVAQLIDYADLVRSVSKTHLHIRLDGTSLWVTDRNSTNGSAVATPEGQRQALNPSQPVLVPAGSTVYFGDRHFVVGSA